MRFVDDQASVCSDDVVVPSSQQQEYSSEPPRKRRRLARFPLGSDDDSASSGSQASVELPPSDAHDYMEVDDELLGEQRSKYEAFMHEPAYVESQQNTFVTQLDQPFSSPTRIRGPRWRKKSSTPSPSPEIAPPLVGSRQATAKHATNVLIAEDFDDDDIEALMDSQTLDVSNDVLQITDDNFSIPTRTQAKNMRQTTLFGIHTTQNDPRQVTAQQRAHNWRLNERNETPTHHKINEDAMEKWIFPLNVGSIRDYQYNIVHKALFNNLLVALPTGLGKTFIAAAVMMNWYNWTKDAQMVFMAPTKPLVAQQIDACFHIAGIPRSQTTLMTGEIPVHIRAEEWKAKRVFFMTPQTLINDLTSGIADPKRIVLLVVDEAHKATRGYAYTKVVEFLRRFNNSYRVLALTATPGSTVESVQNVIDGLDIARVEIRTEDSLDIRSFVHQRNTEIELFDFSDEINMCMELFGKAVKPVVDKLCSQNAYWSKDPTAITLFGLLQAQKQWFASDAGRKANQGVKGMIHACFKPLMSLAHNLELLKFHGIGPFYAKMKVFQDAASSGGKYAKLVTDHESFRTLMARIQTWINNDDFVGHPKLSYLNSVVLNHFMDAGNAVGRADGRPPSDTRIMIFAHYRDSAEEICRVLNRHKPMIRAHVFVGQAATKDSEGMDQKTQSKTIQEFKAGTYNTLVATSIGEEGLDIGEVDLIVCYDCSKSPIRMLQRMGRTGRKRAGNIVMLLMRGKEERDYYSAKDNYSKMQEVIESGKQFAFHDERSPRIVPKAITPIVSKEVIEIPIENTQAGSIEPSKSKARPKKKSAKKFHMPDGVETGFTFLSGKNDKPKSVIRKTKKKSSYLDNDDAPLPPDSAVLLSAEQEIDLEERYASIAGDEPQFVYLVQLGSQLAKVQAKARTRLVSHSMTTNRVITGLGLAKEGDRYLQRPTMLLNNEVADIASDDGEGAPRTEVPFWASQQEARPEVSQTEALPELDGLFGESRSVNSAHLQVPRSRRNIVRDDEDDD